MAALSDLNPDADPASEEFGLRMNLTRTTVHGTAGLAIDHRLIGNGLSAGPAVSLKGSPIVSPMTAALCASNPFPPSWPDSMYFLALSQAPPALDS